MSDIVTDDGREHLRLTDYSDVNLSDDTQGQPASTIKPKLHLPIMEPDQSINGCRATWYVIARARITGLISDVREGRVICSTFFLRQMRTS